MGVALSQGTTDYILVVIQKYNHNHWTKLGHFFYLLMSSNNTSM